MPPFADLPAELRSFLQLVRDCIRLALPYGPWRLAITLAAIFANGLMQIVGVTSVFSFFALAADPERIQRSQLGSTILTFLPEIDHRSLLIVSGLVSVALLFVANASNLACEILCTRYGHSLGHFLRVGVMETSPLAPTATFLNATPACSCRSSWAMSASSSTASSSPCSNALPASSP